MSGVPPDWTASSGDLIADRRFGYAEALAAEGDHAAAADLFQQITERVPGWPPAWFGYGKALLASGQQADAAHAFTRCQTLDPPDRLGAGTFLARLRGHADQAAMSDAYIAGLFDEYAPRFDTHLVSALAYRAPTLLVEALARAKSPPTFARVLDLGCGTGQMAKALDRSAQSIIGVDLSARMLVEAEKTGLYAALHRAELLKFLAGEAAASADLIIAADVFCYVPDLWPVFTESARVLMTGGTLAFTVQTHAGEGVIVGEDSRMHHAPRHVEALLAQSGLAVLELRDASSRKDRGIDVPGAVFVSMKA